MGLGTPSFTFLYNFSVVGSAASVGGKEEREREGGPERGEPGGSAK